jgi:hypothetical protein
MVRMNFQIRWCVNRIVIPIEVKESRSITLWQLREILAFRSAPLRMTAHVHLKPRIEIRSGVLKCYPADAVQADHPFPFSNGWMTVAPASDFQSRHVIFCGRPSLQVLSNSGSGITPRNLEHRRVNVRSRNQNLSGSLKSRWSRVERKALVFFPTLNERLSALKELFPQYRSELAL